jgi:hypothetical protein
VLATMPGADGGASLVHLRRLRYQDLLLVPGTPTPGPRITFAAGQEDLEARARLLRGEGPSAAASETTREGGEVSGPLDTPWFTRDLVVTDPDGYTVVLTAPLPPDVERDPEWSATVRASVGRRPERQSP